jgi:hypothetical protein
MKTANKTKSGAKLIAGERRRQVKEKGYTSKHDDGHDDGSIPVCAAAIALNSEHYATIQYARFKRGWHEERASYVARKYADDRVRQLVIAGALIAAEIDRLQRVRK